MSGERLQYELQRGGRFVFFYYTFSVLIMTFRRGSSIYFVPAGESVAGKALMYSLLTFLVGWWGFPWGPIYTIQSLFVNLSGGKDVTGEVVQALTSSTAPDETPPGSTPSNAT
ncbi:MAG: hypothetical protein KDK35_06210 [Leptospiraceae bacterium]|nr:hypothetical protein [Leptospiraceae bacterium]